MGYEETLVTPVCICDLGRWDRTAYRCMLAGVVRDRHSAVVHFCVAAVEVYRCSPSCPHGLRLSLAR